MTYYPDLTDYTYHGGEYFYPGTKNVGWLAAGHSFEVWTPAETILDRLWEYCKISVAQMRGVHECEFCRKDEAFLAERNGERLLLGTSEIRVFSKSRNIYAAPTLIYHYVAVHHYRPPEEVVQALLEGPSPSSEEYFERLRELNLEWNETTVPDLGAKRQTGTGIKTVQS
jgi:hypothetical protein